MKQWDTTGSPTLISSSRGIFLSGFPLSVEKILLNQSGENSSDDSLISMNFS